MIECHQFQLPSWHKVYLKTESGINKIIKAEHKLSNNNVQVD